MTAGTVSADNGPAANNVLDRLGSVIDELVGTDVTALADGEALRTLSRSLSRLDATLTKAAAAFEASGAWAGVGALSGAAWLAAEEHLPISEVRRRFRLGRALRQLPKVESAWSNGDISCAHVGRFVAARNPRTAEALARDEEMLLAEAKSRRFEGFARIMAYWEGMADEDGSEDEAAAQKRRRDVYLVQSFGGMYLGKMTFDPISGSIVACELERVEKMLFEADWAEAKERLGRDPDLGELRRSAAQRRADAMVEMATRSRTAPADGQRPRPLFSVLVGYETLHGRICELANGSILPPGSLLPWLEPALVERAVFGTKNRVEVSHKARLFSGATLRGLQIRDHEGCTHPYCFAPAWRSQADHVVPYAQGGPTTQDNGRMVCGAHNRARNHTPDHPAWTRQYRPPDLFLAPGFDEAVEAGYFDPDPEDDPADLDEELLDQLIRNGLDCEVGDGAGRGGGYQEGMLGSTGDEGPPATSG